MMFYLGVHHPNWLSHANVPLFISHRRLSKYRTLPVAAHRWALDSGGFSELKMFGGWVTSPRTYVDAVHRYMDEIGLMDWASPQDYMCEPDMLAKTGLSVPVHQLLTTQNFLVLRDLAPDIPFIPVLQGWTISDYVRHAEAYYREGIPLHLEPRVGIGSVCRRQGTDEIRQLLSVMSGYGFNLHGFGVKSAGIRAGAQYLASSDSMAWSYGGRRTPTICGSTTHKNEANCMTFAMDWRSRILDEIDRNRERENT